MYKVRLQFSKQGGAAYISHLDLMKTLQRSFCRAKLPVRYSEGFNPHIYLSILVPLSTGYESQCELCDFDLTCDEMPQDLLERLNAVLPYGLQATAAGQAERPVNQVAYSGYEITWSEGDAQQMQALFQAPVLLEKRSKRGSREVNVCDYIKEISFRQEGEKVCCSCILSAGNDPLNPSYITAALQQAALLSDSVRVRYLRSSILDENCQKFF